MLSDCTGPLGLKVRVWGLLFSTCRKWGLTRPSVPGDLQGYRIKREKIYPEAYVLPAKPQTGHLVMSFFQTASTSCAMDQ